MSEPWIPAVREAAGMLLYVCSRSRPEAAGNVDSERRTSVSGNV